MSLCKFLDFNKKCPICDEPLHLYMQWVNSMCFQAHSEYPGVYGFDFFKAGQKENEEKFKDEFVILNARDDKYSLEFSSNALFNEAKKYQVYFFYLCNPSGFKDKSWGDYEINLYKGCYYRSSAFMELKKKEKRNEKWTFETTDLEKESLINNDESFSFKQLNSNDIERVYMLNLNYDLKETKLWHYAVSPEERVQEGFSPKLFSKTLPILNQRPDFSIDHRESLLSRFDSWIIMS